MLVILLLSSCCAAASATEVNFFVHDYLSESETFTKTTFNTTEGEYYIINITGTPSFILFLPSDGSIKMLVEKEEIRDALIKYYATLGLTHDNLKLNETYKNTLLSLIDEYNKTREKEYECRAYIGIDRFECIDYETCWRACYTPVCQQMKIGAGKTFLELLWDFSNLTSSIDSNLSAFNQTLSSLSELTSLGELDELITFVDNIKNSSVRINNNDLFNPMAMGFCQVVGYNLTYLTYAKINLLAYREMVAPLLTLEEAAEEIHNRTLERVSLKEQLIKERLCSSLTANNSLLLSSLRANPVLNTSKGREKLSSLEKAGALEGCSGMGEAQLQESEQRFLNLLNETQEYAGRLQEVVSLKRDVDSILLEIRGDPLLYFQATRFSSELDEIENRIQVAELTQLPGIASRLVQLKGEMQEVATNRVVSFISGLVTSPFILLIFILFVLWRKFRK